MRDRVMTRGDGLAMSAAVIVGLTTVLYVAIMVSQDEGEFARVGFVVVLLATAIAGVVGSMTFGDLATRGAAAGFAAGVLISLGTLALLSIGLLLLIAGVLMVLWLTRTQEERRASGGRGRTVAACVVGAVLPLALLFQP
jgi:hypothetical protein